MRCCFFRKRSRILRKTTALIVSTCFTSLNIFNLTPVWSEPAAPQKVFSDFHSFSLPADLGRIETSRLRLQFSKPPVIVIQDAHGIPSAQTALHHLLSYLEKKYGIRTVATEGASSPFDTVFFQCFPERERLEKLFQSWVESGDLSGAAWSAVERSQDRTAFFGIENAELYEAGRQAYLEGMAEAPVLQKQIQDLRADIWNEQSRIYAPALRQIVESQRRLESDHPALGEILQDLLKASGQSAASLAARYPRLGAVMIRLHSAAAESNPAIQKELVTLADTILKKPRIPKTVLSETHQALQALRTGERPLAQLARELEILAQRVRIPVFFSPAVQEINEQQKIIEHFQGEVFLRELNQWIRQIKDSLYRSALERQLDEKDQALGLLMKGTRLEWTRTDWRQARAIKKFPEGFSEKRLQAVFQFYEIAEKREEAMFERLSASLTTPTIVIAGGFHTAGFQERFRRAGIPYVVLSPKMTAISEKTNYSALMNDQAAWRKSSSAHPPAPDLFREFAEAVRDHLLQETVRSDALRFIWRDRLLKALDRENRLQEASYYLSILEPANASLETPPHNALLSEKKDFALSASERQSTQLPRVTLPLAHLHFLSRPAAISRSELRQAPWQHQLLEGVGEHKPDWQRMNILAEIILEHREKTLNAFSAEDLRSEAEKRFAAQLVDGPETVDIKSLLERMAHIQLLAHAGRADLYQLGAGVTTEIFAVKTNQIRYILKDLTTGLKYDLKSKDETSMLLHSIENYMRAVESWPLFPVESDYPVLKAVALMDQEMQQELVKFLLAADSAIQHSRLVEKIIMMVMRKVTENLVDRQAPDLKGRDLIYASSETWFPIGGLGRVGQYHTAAAKEIVGDQARVITIEPRYDYVETSEGALEKLNYQQLVDPVEGLTDTPVWEFPMRVRKWGGRHTVTVQVFRGVNRFGVEAYFIRDKPEEGRPDSYYTKVPYRYGQYGGATWTEFTEFLSKASLILSKKIQKEKLDRLKAISRESEYKAPLLWGNDGQLGLLPVLKRYSDELEMLSPEEQKRLANDLGFEMRDLIQNPDDEASLKTAFTWFTTHTFNNRTGDNSEDMLRGAAIPVKFWSGFRRGETYDATSGGIRFADGTNGVAAMHVQGVRHIDPNAQISAFTNGDNLLASSEVIRAIFAESDFQARFPGANPEFPTLEQVMAVKKIAIERLKTNAKLLALDPNFANLDPNQLVMIYAGRLVDEKAGLKRAFSPENIEHLVRKGVQVIILGNIQGGGESRKMYDELKALQVRFARDGIGPGRLIVASGWKLTEQRAVWAAAHIQVNDSHPRTEAAGFSETDIAVNLGIEVTLPAPEGIYQQQGEIIRWDIPGIGNTVIANAENHLAYRYVFDKLVEKFQNAPLDFASRQATSARLSRILDARLTMVTYLNAFGQMMHRMENPYETLTEVAGGHAATTQFTYDEWLRRRLSETLPKQGAILLGDDSPAPNVEMMGFFMRGVSGADHQNIILIEKGAHSLGATQRGVVKGREAVEAIFSQLEPEQDRVQVADVKTGQIYGAFSKQELLDRGLYFDFSGIQILRFVGVSSQATSPEDTVSRVTKASLFFENDITPGIKATIQALLPSDLLAEWGANPEQLSWWFDSEGFAHSNNAPAQWTDPGFYAIVSKGSGRLTVSLTDHLAEIYSPHIRQSSANNVSHPAHIVLTAQQHQLRLGLGRMHPFEQANKEFGASGSDSAFHYWFVRHLVPFAQRFGFRSIQLEQRAVSSSTLEKLSFVQTRAKWNGAPAEWTFYLSQAARSELRQTASPVLRADASAPRNLAFSRYVHDRAKAAAFASEESLDNFSNLVSAYLEHHPRENLRFAWMMPWTEDANIQKWLRGFFERMQTLGEQEKYRGRLSVRVAVTPSENTTGLTQFQAAFPDVLEVVSTESRRQSGQGLQGFLSQHPNALFHGLGHLESQIRREQQYREIHFDAVDWEDVFPLLTYLYFVSAQSTALGAEEIQMLPQTLELETYLGIQNGRLVVFRKAQEWMLQAEMSRIISTMA